MYLIVECSVQILTIPGNMGTFVKFYSLIFTAFKKPFLKGKILRLLSGE